MKKTIYLFLLLSSFAFSQQQGNLWYFGNMAGVDFSSGNPVAISGGQTPLWGGAFTGHSEGTAVICDSTGSLLFYTNGETIWNQNHVVMPNGNGLLGHSSSSQSSLIIPKPGSSRFFYVFTTDGMQNNLQNGYRYSMIDMCLNNGKGDVIPNVKNIKLTDSVAEKQVAVKHTNGVDYWIITHKFFSNQFYAYLVTSTTISPPVVSAIGSIHTLSPSYGTALGQMKASPNGQKLALVNGNSSANIAEYFDFNPSTGVVSNMVNIQTNIVHNYYGVSFSPDNSKLYISSCLNGNGIYQFDLSAGGGNPASVVASKYLVTGVYNHLALQLANNGKIYTTRTPTSRQHLGCINNPNLAGAACVYQDSAVFLGTVSSYGLPNFLDSYGYTNTRTYNCDSVITAIKEHTINKIDVSPNPFTNYLKIDYGNNSQPREFILYNMFGKEMYRTKIKSGENIVFKNELPQGVYLYQLINTKTKEPTAFGRIVKE
ncbi:MAG: hypothetical protein K0S32_351 [Bacteroidetes bacterium]|jgi:hypothetical protein|nr:hypothetical protein [Bacteroidota bacterium]